MMFSVWNYPARQYDYYQSPGNSKNYDARGTKYRALNQPPQGPLESEIFSGVGSMGGARAQGAPGRRVAIGFAPEALAMKLPAQAQYVGSGSDARGVIATKPAGALYGLAGLAVATRPSAAAYGLSGLCDDEDEDMPPPVMTQALASPTAAVQRTSAPAPQAVLMVPAVEAAAGMPIMRIVGASIVAGVVGAVVQKLLR